MAIYYVSGIPYPDELYHWGIKGQKWGVRRYQNADGTYTLDGKQRYGRISDETARKLKSNAQKEAKEEKRIARKEKYEARKRMIKDAANVHKMSDAELLEKIGRLSNEKRLMELTYERLTSSADPKKQMMIQAGKKVAGVALAGIGTYAGAAILTGTFDPKELAKYAFPKPKNK